MLNLIRQTKSGKKGGVKMKGILRLIPVLAVVVAMFGVSVPAMAATSATVTVTATPSYIACTNAPDTWTLNDIVGDGVTPKGTIAPDTIYYSNPLGDGTAPSDPVVDGECTFTLTNTSTITTDVFVNISDFTGGSAAMENSNDGTNGAGTYGAYSYCTGMTYSSGKVLCKTTGSAATKSDLAPSTNIKWGLALETQTGAWFGGTSSTATITVSLAAA